MMCIVIGRAGSWLVRSSLITAETTQSARPVGCTIGSPKHSAAITCSWTSTTIPAGVDFVEYLNSQVAMCDVFLAVIGPNWLDAKDDDGRRRFDNPDDFVTIEIAAALERKIRVIP
jgi:hypothetical protein